MTPYYEQDGIAIYHADVFDVLDTIDGFDALITDPPYSSGGMVRGDRANRSTLQKYTDNSEWGSMPNFTGDNRDQRGFLLWCNLWMGASRLRASTSANCLTFTDWRQLPTLTDALQLSGWVWMGTWGCGTNRMGAQTLGAFALKLNMCYMRVTGLLT